MQQAGKRIGMKGMMIGEWARAGARSAGRAAPVQASGDKARMARALRMGCALGATLALAACGGMPTDWDLRGRGAFSTADAAREAGSRRPQPDDRGVISYPGYQVVVATRGETPRAIAERLEIDADAFARHNAINADTPLRGGETLVVPGSGRAVTEPMAAPGIRESRLDSETAPGPEPIRHEVERGETVFSIARLYNVTARSLAEWNGLGSDMSVREGQILMVPKPQTISDAADTRTAARADRADDARREEESRPSRTDSDARPARADDRDEETVTRPGTGSPTPSPPSAARPMPEDSSESAGIENASEAREPVADMAAQRSEGPRLAMPVEGRILRAYQRGRNDGIGIGAPAGTAVRAAAAGTVAAITRDTDQVPIMVVRHEDNLLTVYANIDDIRVERGDRVSSGDTIATVRRGDPSYLHFEVREGLESVDPMPYLQ